MFRLKSFLWNWLLGGIDLGSDGETSGYYPFQDPLATSIGNRMDLLLLVFIQFQVGWPVAQKMHTGVLYPRVLVLENGEW